MGLYEAKLRVIIDDKMKPRGGGLNKKLVAFHLSEAQEELQQMLSEISQDPEYGYGEFFVGMQHAYYHLNTAWNARDVSAAEAEPGSDELFNRWGSFPEDLPLMRID